MRFSTRLDQLAERAVLSVGIDMGVRALSSIPILKSLHFSRPRQVDNPACQAFSVVATN